MNDLAASLIQRSNVPAAIVAVVGLRLSGCCRRGGVAPRVCGQRTVPRLDISERCPPPRCFLDVAVLSAADAVLMDSDHTWIDWKLAAASASIIVDARRSTVRRGDQGATTQGLNGPITRRGSRPSDEVDRRLRFPRPPSPSRAPRSRVHTQAGGSLHRSC